MRLNPQLHSIQESRIRVLNRKPVNKAGYILYWMQQSQRAEYNHALEYAVEIANHYDLPVVVGFGIMKRYPEANLRHYVFMLEGLQETRRSLAERGIQMVVRIGHPADVAVDLGKNAAAIVCDRGYLRHQRAWRRVLAQKAACRVIRVESDAVIPVETLSPKAEYAARTIRPKVEGLLKDYLVGLDALDLQRRSLDLKLAGMNLDDDQAIIGGLAINKNMSPVSAFFKGGTSRAKNRFAEFLSKGLKNYEQHSNQPQTDDISHMSPYLHFGQISPLFLALAVQKAKTAPAVCVARYLEELVVRRELAINFVYYTPDYDAMSCIPAWARETLSRHASDRRPYRYRLSRLTAAKTHDPYWNAAMREMKYTGFMHNYMRMYWAKKILEWSERPESAFATTLYLNNRYFLDGRDPNSYAGVAWNYGVHDRAWPERPIFGKVRYMAASGLERKCDIAAYVDKIDARVDLKKTA